MHELGCKGRDFQPPNKRSEAALEAEPRGASAAAAAAAKASGGVDDGAVVLSLLCGRFQFESGSEKCKGRVIKWLFRTLTEKLFEMWSNQGVQEDGMMSDGAEPEVDTAEAYPLAEPRETN